MNPDKKKILRQIHRVPHSMEELFGGIRRGDRILLAQAITLVESQRSEDQPLVQSLIQACLPFANGSRRIGITGSPGVGKSTFIDTYGQLLVDTGHKVAVLAVDPSSPITAGSILGDKTRMHLLGKSDHAFIRPSAAGDTLGGVARKTREAMILCEAAGYDRILIETVGVGQSETAVRSMSDLFVLLLQPGAGDTLQGIKRGIVELADLVCITKADGDLLPKARQAQAHYTQALHYFMEKESAWIPRVLISSSLSAAGIGSLAQATEDYFAHMAQSQHLEALRRQQGIFWLHETLRVNILERYLQGSEIQAAVKRAEDQVLSGAWSPFYAADYILDSSKQKQNF